MSSEALKVTKTRVELHAHLDGCVRYETLHELMSAKNKLALPGDGSLSALRKALVITQPKDLAHFLTPFKIIIPCIRDDLQVIERIAYEFCEDKALTGCAYVEARYAPHSLLKTPTLKKCSEVVKAVWAGLKRGEQDFGIKARHILCTLIGLNNEDDVLELCRLHDNDGVIGIDTASICDGTDNDEVPLGHTSQVFQKAMEYGIHRTVHAGERGSALMVARALSEYKAERIGHGYRMVADPNVYQTIKETQTHVECCPWSSILTGSVLRTVDKHPIVQFTEDKVNFSINTDDTTVTGTNLNDEFKLCEVWSLTKSDFSQIAINAAKSSFLSDSEKSDLLRTIKSNM